MSQRRMRSTPTPKGFEWEPKTENQKLFKEAIEDKKVAMAYGPAGTGKSYLAAHVALSLLDKAKKSGIYRIILSRPMVTCGEELGFLPGTTEEKTWPFLQPIHDIIMKTERDDLQELINSPRIKALPLALIRGVTIDNEILVVDEAQNIQHSLMKTILTRLGENGKIVLIGDTSQIDIKESKSGFMDAINRFKDDPDVGVVKFGIEDIQRSDFVGRVITSYHENPV